MAFLTRRGARSVTTDLDRVANLFQNQHETLGIPKEYAVKFAYYCDVLSDRVEKHAIKLAADAEKAEAEEADKGEKKEAGCEKLPEGGMRDNCEKKKEEGGDADKGEKKEAGCEKLPEGGMRDNCEKKSEGGDAEKKEASAKKKADDETGLSVDHGTSGFDANVIADEVGGPQEIIQPPSEPWMNDFFTQGWFQELGDLQESGAMSNAAARGAIITKAAKASLARLRRLASASKLAQVEATLTGLHSKLPAGVKLASNIQKQIVAVRTVRNAFDAGVEVRVAADQIVQAVAEQVPYLQQVVAGADAGSISDLVSYGTSIIVEAASAVKGGEMPDFIKEKIDDKKDDKKDDDKKDEKKASEEPKDEKAEDEKKEAAAPKLAEDEKSEKAEDEKKEAKSAEDEEDEDAEKSASTNYGYDLFAN